MKKVHQWIIAVLLLPWALGLSGCGSKQKHQKEDSHDQGKKSAEVETPGEGHEDHGDESAGAAYQDGKGISLSEETKKSMGLELEEVGERELAPTVSLTAQIYRAAAEASRLHGKERSGNAYAMALLPMELKEKLASEKKLSFAPRNKRDSRHEGVVWKIDDTQTALLGKIEVLLELPDPKSSLAVGDFVEAQIPLGEKRKMLAIPLSALLETSTGTYAFVRNGNFLLRTEIKIGAQTDNSVEIAEGLYEGDTIAVKPVQALYLIELRSTKGGGHSH